MQNPQQGYCTSDVADEPEPNTISDAACMHMNDRQLNITGELDCCLAGERKYSSLLLDVLPGR